jgi:hypothetical protein
LASAAGPAGFEVSLLDGEQIGLLEEAKSALPEGQAALMALVTARLPVASSFVEPECRAALTFWSPRWVNREWRN